MFRCSSTQQKGAQDYIPASRLHIRWFSLLPNTPQRQLGDRSSPTYNTDDDN